MKKYRNERDLLKLSQIKTIFYYHHTQISDLIYFAEITIFFDIVAALISVMGIQETEFRMVDFVTFYSGS